MGDVHAELADVDARDLFANQQHELRRDCQLFIELADLRIEESECRRQSRAVDLERRDDFAELPAREVIRQPHEQPSRVLDGRKKCVNCIHNKLVA